MIVKLIYSGASAANIIADINTCIEGGITTSLDGSIKRPSNLNASSTESIVYGTNYANTGWVQTEHVDTIGTDTVSFSQFSGAGTFLAGDGLTLTGNEFSVVGTSNRISVSASGVDIDTNYAGQTSITTLGTIATGTWNANVIGPVYGGTGLSSYTTGDLVYASAANTLASLGIGSTGEILTIAAGVPAWTDTIDGGTY